MGGQGGNDRLTTTGGQDRLVGDDGRRPPGPGLRRPTTSRVVAAADWVSAGDGTTSCSAGPALTRSQPGQPRSEDTVVDLAAETAVGYGTDVVESFENAMAQSNGARTCFGNTARQRVLRSRCRRQR
jgi:hypothetical protein